jgi:porphobilinogen synthase
VRPVSTPNLIAPLFVQQGEGVIPLGSMPGQFRWSPDTVAAEAWRLEGLGVGGVILFGVPDAKDDLGSPGWDPEGPVPRALRNIAAAAPGLVRMADVCLCEYTDLGHVACSGRRRDNDATLPLLARKRSRTRAGADVVARAMMVGR